MKTMRRRTRIPALPCPFQTGDRIRPVAMFEHHNYEEGRSYSVSEIDPGDCTLRARDENDSLGGWIRWCDCRAASEIGWEWLKGQLPAETLELLTAFNGLERLTLRKDVTTKLVAGMPSLKQRILGCIENLETTPEHP
jgi:hypothetical protein